MFKKVLYSVVLVSAGGLLGVLPDVKDMSIVGSSSNVVHQAPGIKISYVCGNLPLEVSKTFIVGLEELLRLEKRDFSHFYKSLGYKALREAVAAQKSTSLLFQCAGDITFVVDVRFISSDSKKSNSLVAAEIVIYGTQKDVPAFVIEIAKKSLLKQSFSAAVIAGTALVGVTGLVAAGASYSGPFSSKGSTQGASLPQTPFRAPHSFPSVVVADPSVVVADPCVVVADTPAHCPWSVVPATPLSRGTAGNPERDYSFYPSRRETGSLFQRPGGVASGDRGTRGSQSFVGDSGRSARVANCEKLAREMWEVWKRSTRFEPFGLQECVAGFDYSSIAQQTIFYGENDEVNKMLAYFEDKHHKHVLVTSFVQQYNLVKPIKGSWRVICCDVPQVQADLARGADFLRIVPKLRDVPFFVRVDSNNRMNFSFSGGVVKGHPAHYKIEIVRFINSFLFLKK